MSDLTAIDLRRAVVRYLHWWETYIVTEFSIDNGGERADLIQLMRSGYLVEYELKTSTADWKLDLERKAKWSACPRTGHPLLSRFFWVVPGKRSTLGKNGCVPAIKIPKNLPEGTGILVVARHGQHDDLWCTEFRAASRHAAPKCSDELRSRIMETFYYRFWRLQGKVDEQREYRQAQKRLGAPPASETRAAARVPELV